MGAHAVTTGRVYDPRGGSAGLRVLVDRIWPRGLTKAAAGLDEWIKAAAPTTQLRKGYGHAPDRFAEFRQRYLAELTDDAHAQSLARLRELVDAHDVVLLTASKNVEGSLAEVLAEFLRGNSGA